MRKALLALLWNEYHLSETKIMRNLDNICDVGVRERGGAQFTITLKCE